MATKLFLRNTANAAIGNFYDMVTTAGSASTTGVVNTTTAGTQIQWTRTAGGTVLEWISGKVPAGGFTLSGTMTFSIWAQESNMNANIGGRARVFKRTSGGVETEVAVTPFDDGVEFGTAAAEMTWTGTPMSTSFAENDRIICRYYITNVGVMATGFTGTITYNAADAATGDSFFQINENVTFKAESVNAETDGNSAGTSTPTGIGAAQVLGTGESTASATGSGSAASALMTTGATTAAATVSADGGAGTGAAGVSDGVATAAAIGAAGTGADGSAPGTSTATATAAAGTTAAGSTAAAATAQAVSAAQALGTGSSSGAASPAGAAAAALTTTGVSAGLADVRAVGAALWQSLGLSSGSSIVLGEIENGGATDEATGEATGTSSASGHSAAMVMSTGSVNIGSVIRYRRVTIYD